MKKIHLGLTLFLFIATALSQHAVASHYGGATLSTECINPCTTRIHWRFYRICTTPATFGPLQITWTSSNPNCSSPSPVTPLSPEVISEVTPLCASITPGCANRPNIGGAEEIHVWQDYNTCNPPGCAYTLTWSTCCRNPGITSTTMVEGMAVVNTMDFGAGCNSSPTYPRPNVMFMCLDRSQDFFVGGIDPDGDSLTYDLVDCYSIANTPLSYAAGYSGTDPLGPAWDVQLDPNSGMLSIRSLTPNSYQIAPLCVQVNEYRNGQLIATSIRDMYIVVINCPNNTHDPQIGSPFNLSLGAFAQGGDSVLACPGQPLCFDLEVSDSDSGQVVRVGWVPGLPGATFTDASNASITDTIYGNPGTARFCWPNPTPGTHYLILQSRDDVCPYEAEQDKVITLVIGSPLNVPIISGNGTINVCQTVPDTLHAPPGQAGYLWSTGATTASIVVGTPGTYAVTVNAGTGCTWLDSFVVVPDTLHQLIGTVLGYDNTPLANEPIFLHTLNWADSTLLKVDSTTTDALGRYAFCQVPWDTVYVEAFPARTSSPGNMPSYPDTAMYWNDTRAIVNRPDTVNFTCRKWETVPGNCVVGGTIREAGTQLPVPGIRVILRAPLGFSAVDYTYTDANGYFLFDSLTFFSYVVTVDKPFVDHQWNVPFVSAQMQNCVNPNLDFVLHPTFLELLPFVQAEEAEEWAISLYPNPVGPSTERVMLRMKSSGAAETRIRLLDLQGKTLRELVPAVNDPNELAVDIPIGVLSAGLYFVEIQSDGKRKVEKLSVHR